MVTLPHGETNVTLACQNRCVSCNHFIPIQDPWFIDSGDFEHDLALAAGVMHFQVFNLVGGEPTLHPQIMDLIRILAASSITNRIEITSNGQGWRRWTDAFYREIDDLIVTPYKLDDEGRAAITAKCADFGTHLEWHPVIFTYAAPAENHSAETAAFLYQNCWYRRNRNVIDNGYFHRCCIGRFTPSLLMGLEREHDATRLDGLTPERLDAYLNQSETPAGCLRCNANMGRQLPWREQADRAKWLKESLG